AHDLLVKQAGSAYVKAVVTSNNLRAGGNVTGLILENSIPVPAEDAWSSPSSAWSSYGAAWTAPRTGVAIRLLDGTVITKEVTAASDESDTLSFVTPFADPGVAVLDAGCLVVSGIL